MSVLPPVLALAALDSINPSMIGATVYLLFNDLRYRRHVVIYLGAVATHHHEYSVRGRCSCSA